MTQLLTPPPLPTPIIHSAKYGPEHISSLNPQYKVLCSLFLVYVQVKPYQNILKLRSGPLFFLIIKKRSGTSFPASFSA